MTAILNGHGVDNTIPCIWSTASMNDEVVRSIEKHFLDKGAKGGRGGGDSSTCYIYAYKISPSTRE